MNGLLREYFPKGQDFTNVSEERIQEVFDELNKRPRKCLGYLTPYEVFYKKKLHLTWQFAPALRRKILHRAQLCLRFSSSFGRKICANMEEFILSVIPQGSSRCSDPANILSKFSTICHHPRRLYHFHCFESRARNLQEIIL